MPRHVHPHTFIIHPPDDLVRNNPELRRLSDALSRKYADNQVVTEKELEVMGSALWRLLDRQDAFDTALSEAGAAIFPVIVESNSAEAQALPWETLHHPTHGFIGRHPGFTLTRRMKGAPVSAPPLDKAPLRVLLFTSLPDNVHPETGRLNVEEEQARVQEALLPWIAQGLVRLEMPDDGRFDTLKELLRSFDPHVLFLSGHGKFHHQPHTGAPPHGEFYFENEVGESEGVREDDIAAALIGAGVRVVALSACESSKAASDALNNGLAQRLSAQGIPHVIGMRESVQDSAGILFAYALCDSLARRERIDTALQAARIAIRTPTADIPRRAVGNMASRELSQGQWCLPMLLSAAPEQPLIDWEFSPRKVDAGVFKTQLDTVTLPFRFVGRRAELRSYKNDLLAGKIRSLLLIGAGGQGKTALAGKLALDLRAHGYRVFAWSARPEHPWQDFEMNLELALDEANVKKYDRFRPRMASDAARAGLLLRLLQEQFSGRLVLFLDNLETLQEPQTLELRDPLVTAWLEAARATEGVILLATSRWLAPDWNAPHLMLGHANYGDFLQLARGLAERGRMPKSLLHERERLRSVYAVLGGNCRGLEFFAAATLLIENPAEEAAFLEALADVKEELQTDMALDAIYDHLPEPARRLLRRLPVYLTPVPAEGMLKLATDLSDDPEALLARLAAVSLLEAYYEPHWEVMEYHCPPLVRDRITARGLRDDNPAWTQAAADYHLYLLRYERPTLNQAIAAHHALRRAGRHEEANRLVLDRIVGPLTRTGFYRTLLDEWLPLVRTSEEPATNSEALGQTGKLLHHIGDYETALSYLKQSLAIMQQIGDKAGLCATLFNIGHIHLQNDENQEAVDAWVTVYLLAKQMNLARVLSALANLAPELGMPEGLAGWEMLAQRRRGDTIPM